MTPIRNDIKNIKQHPIVEGFNTEAYGKKKLTGHMSAEKKDTEL